MDVRARSKRAVTALPLPRPPRQADAPLISEPPPGYAGFAPLTSEPWFAAELPLTSEPVLPADHAA